MTSADHRTLRRALRREVAGTIGLLADETDFSAMRRYRTFTFADHPTYLREVERLLRTLRADGRHTTLALFDPEEYAAYCTETGLDPDTPTSRGHFTAQLATDSPTVPYDGRALTDLVPDLIDTTARQSIWEYAQHILATIGDCADCGEDIGRASFNRAAELLTSICAALTPGSHHLVTSVSVDDTALLAALRIDSTASQTTTLDESDALEFTTVLAAGLATQAPGGVVLRTSRPGTPDHVSGWRLGPDRLVPLTEAQVFAAYCTDAETGEPLAPEPGVEYGTPPPLAPDPGNHPH
ncbi:hypothetical protein [Streptomyces sp. NPDC002851]